MNIVQWILRVGIAGTFFGHGFFALQVKESWIHLITAFGFSIHAAKIMMPLFGAIDMVVAVLVLVKPFRVVLLYAAFWAFLTALARPVAGLPVLDFIERSANWAAPLALFYWKKYNAS
jgi:hypothetical protein